jgi:low affinity Fe/Cu permease
LFPAGRRTSAREQRLERSVTGSKRETIMSQQPKARARRPRHNGASAAVATGGANGGSSAKQRAWFTRIAHAVAWWAGQPTAFLLALAFIIVWAVTGPLFGFSDTWQLVVNTATTIVTFLMVFLIQNTQNRDTLALQIKLAELIIAMRGAHNRLATVEDMDDAALEALHNEYRKRAEATLASLEERRGVQARTS